MSELWKYFSKILRLPWLYHKGPLQGIAQGLAHIMDQSQRDIVYLREQFFPQLCEKDMVALHGTSRGLVRHQTESDDAFRARVAHAYAWHMLGGKVEGLSQILAFYGFPTKSIHSLKDFTPSRWAEFEVQLSNSVLQNNLSMGSESLDFLVWLIQEYKPARSVLARVYTTEYDMRPIVVGNGPILGEGWLSYYSGTPLIDDMGNEILVSFGKKYSTQSDDFFDASTVFAGRTERCGARIPYIDRFIVGISPLGQRATAAPQFCNSALFSILWAERASVPRPWSGFWDARGWLDITGFDRQLPTFSMYYRTIDRSQLELSNDIVLGDINARLGATYAVTIDNPAVLSNFSLSEHDNERKELRLRIMEIHTASCLTPCIDVGIPILAMQNTLSISSMIREPYAPCALQAHSTVTTQPDIALDAFMAGLTVLGMQVPSIITHDILSTIQELHSMSTANDFSFAECAVHMHHTIQTTTIEHSIQSAIYARTSVQTCSQEYAPHTEIHFFYDASWQGVWSSIYTWADEASISTQ
ncbi:MAG: phage tail protein [Pseudomonadota bacterium]